MNGPDKSVNNSMILSEACAWLAQLDSGDISSRDLAVFREWLQRSPAHERAIKDAAHTWSDLNSLTDLMDKIEVAHGSEKALMRPMRATYFKPAIGVFAAMLMAAMTFFAVQHSSSIPDSSNAPITYMTQIGETRQEVLPDGSRVTLNTNSQVRVRYETDVRHIELIAGEALFDVAKDSERPFSVYTDQGVITAVGTVFVVRVDAEKKVDLAVTEGAVEVETHRIIKDDRLAENITPKRTVGFVKSGHTATITASTTTIIPMDVAEIETDLSWRNGMLNFSGESLIDVVSEVSRYTEMQIIIGDANLEQIPIGGVFPANDVDAFLEVLELGFSVNVNKLDEKTVYLSPQSSQ